MASSVGAASVAAEPLPVREIVAETTQNAELAGRKVAGSTASALSFVTKGLSAALDRVLPEPDDNGPKIPAMLAAALAILIPTDAFPGADVLDWIGLGVAAALVGVNYLGRGKGEVPATAQKRRWPT